ncbi:MAG: efflux RND transporter permease subunit [Peptococcaceae bacterium]|nr:efflux RND transporter permease subunit [Peptococcaceae bacterium]
MNLLTRFSLKYPVVVFMLIFLVTVGGIYSAGRMKTEAMPDITVPVIVIATPYPGASPADVLTNVTKPLEQALRGVTGVKNANSTSTEGLSAISLEFDFSRDMDKAERNVNDAINNIILPDNVLKPTVTRISFGSAPIMQLSASAPGDPAALQRMVEENVVPELSGISGVGQVQVNGSVDPNVYIKLLPDKLKDNNLTLNQVKQALQSNNISFPTGEVIQGDKSMPVQVQKKLSNIADLKNLVLTLNPNPMAGLGDAFSSIGKGFQGLGSAIAGLGEGVKGISSGLQAQLKLVAAIDALQTQIAQDQTALNSLKAATPLTQANPLTQTPSASQQNTLPAQPPVNTAILTQKIAAEQAALQKMLATLTNMQVGMSSALATNNIADTPSHSITVAKPKTQAIKVVKLGDIAEITTGAERPAMITRTNGKPSVVINIIKDPDGNVVDINQAIQQKLPNLAQTLPSDVKLDVLYDQSTDIKQSINGMLREGLLGALFAVLVIFIFLRNWRSTIVAMVSIPLSILIALTIINRFNITLNIMTLGGMAVAIGRVVDDSIVVIENIYRRLQSGETPGPQLINSATKEVTSAITSSTLTTVAVFLPLGLISGMVGKIFLPFAATVVLALLASLLVAVTVVPLLSRLLLLKHPPKSHQEGWLAHGYRRLLSWSLRHKAVVALVAILLLTSSMALVPRIGTNFLPSTTENALNLKIEFPPGTKLTEVNEQAMQVEKLLQAIPDVKLYQTMVGSPQNQLSERGQLQGSNIATLFVALQPNADVAKVSAEVRQKLAPLQGKSSITLLTRSVTGSTDQVDVLVNGKDINKIAAAGTQITTALKDIPGLVNVANNLSASKPEISIAVNQAAAAKEGLSAIMVAGALREMLTDSVATTIDLNGQTNNVMLSLKTDNLSSLAKLGELDIVGMSGNVKLNSIATISQQDGSVSIMHRDGNQFASITGDVVGSDTGAVSKAVSAKLNTLELPQGVSWSLGGTTEQMNQSFGDMGIAMLVAVVLVYVVMVIAFGGALAPFAILFSLPFAVIGSLLGLYLTQQQISMASMIGALMLIGIVVTNAIVLVDRVQQLKLSGQPTKEALLNAGATRLRPILMTAIATICALLPLAMGFEQGTIISEALAIVVIGGLATSTILTLVIVPIAYSFFDSVKMRFLGQSTTAAGEQKAP